MDFIFVKVIIDEISGIVNLIVVLNVYIVMGSSNGMILVWDIENREIIVIWKVYLELVNLVVVIFDE